MRYYRSMPTRKTNQAVINGLGTTGYVFCLLQWFWMLVLYLDAILPVVQTLISDEQPTPTPIPPPSQSEPSLLVLFAAFAIAVAVIALSVFALAKIPRAIAQNGKRITHAPAKFIIPAITARHPLKPAEKRQLSQRIIFGIKLLLCGIPALIPFVVFSDSLPQPVIFTVTLFLFALSLSLFCLQALFSKLIKVPYETST